MIDFAAAARAYAGRPQWLQELQYGSNGNPTKGVANIAAVLRHHPDWAGKLSFDAFRGVPLLDKKEIVDTDATSLREWFELEPHLRMAVSDSDVHKVLDMVSAESTRHPVRDYLSSLVWDGTPRIGTWLSTYLGVESNLYTCTVGSRWLISACRRVWQPGCKVDSVLILEGTQGAGKSTALKIMAGEPWFTDTPIDIGSKDAYLSIRGRWIVELGELASLKKADLDRAKTFFSSSTDDYRPPYGRRPVSVPRQCVFAGSTNLDQYLHDETGNRRFWPVRCGKIDLDGLRRDRDQLWAEAMAAMGNGVPWWINDPAVLKLAEAEQDERRPQDSWATDIRTWLDSNDARALRAQQKGGVTTRDILIGALGFEPNEIHNGHEQRISKLMKADLGATYERPRIGAAQLRVWVPAS